MYSKKIWNWYISSIKIRNCHTPRREWRVKSEDILGAGPQNRPLPIVWRYSDRYLQSPSCMYEWEVSSTRVVSPQSTRHKFCTLSVNLDFQEFLSDFIISWYPTRYATCSDILHAVTMLDPWRSHLVLGSSSDRLYQIRRIVSVSVSKNKYFY